MIPDNINILHLVALLTTSMTGTNFTKIIADFFIRTLVFIDMMKPLLSKYSQPTETCYHKFIEVDSCSSWVINLPHTINKIKAFLYGAKLLLQTDSKGNRINYLRCLQWCNVIICLKCYFTIRKLQWYSQELGIFFFQECNKILPITTNGYFKRKIFWIIDELIM